MNTNYPGKLLEHMESFKYGQYKHNGIWYIQSPDNLEKSKLGVCHDFSRYIYDKLSKAGYQCQLVYVTDSAVSITHSFVTYVKDKDTYWIEAAWSKHFGIHKLQNEYMDVVKIWSKSENLDMENIAVNEHVAVSKMGNKNLTWNEYLDIVTEPFKQESSGHENLSAQSGELVRIDWDYSNHGERAKHLDAAYKLFCDLDRNQLTIVPWYNDSPSKSEYVKYLTNAKNMGVKYFLYMLGTEYIGYGLYTPSMFKKFRGLNLSNLYVDARYRGRGFGTQMLNDFIAYGKENKYQRLMLQVLDGNPTAQKLYERFGFKPFSHSLELGIEQLTSTSSRLYYKDINPDVESMSSICKDIVLQSKQLSNMSYVGYEDLNSIKRLFRNAANNVYRILQNVRSTVWNGFKDLKRSELQSYVDHNRFTVSHILDTKATILANMDVHIPFKMSSTYYQAVVAVENTLLLLDMENRINTELNVAKAIVSQLMAKSTELSLGTNTISSYELEKLQTSFTKQDACFRSPSRVTKKRFDQVYRRPSSFKDTYTKLSKLTQYEYGVAKVYKCLENIYKQYDIMVNFLEKENPDINKNSLVRVHQHTYTIAKLFDMYGTTMMNVLRLEHNFVLTLEEIKKTQNL